MAFSWLSGWDPRPCFPQYTGPYSVGSTDVEIPVESLPDGIRRPDEGVSTIAFRAYYPCIKAEQQKKPVYWISAPQRETLSGYARFCGASSVTAAFVSMFPNVLNGITIPVTRDADLADAPGEDGRWPTLIFSHGLGGSRNAYSHMCGSLASYGIVVLAPDHRDGSGAVALMRKTSKCAEARAEYRVMKHEPCQETFQGRDRQLRIRLWEVCQVLEATHLIDAGAELDELHTDQTGCSPVKSVLAGFKDRLAVHEPGSVAFAGHSFGGATTVQLLKSAFYYPELKSPLLSVNADASNPPKILSQVTASTRCVLFDPWAMPWLSPDTSVLADKPMPCFSSDEPTATDPDSMIAILSVPFFNWRANLRGLKRILRDPRPESLAQPHIFYPQSSAHLSQSDFAILFPTLTRHLAGDVEPERTFDLNVRGSLEVLRRTGGAWAGLAPKGPAEDDVLDEYVAALHMDDDGNYAAKTTSDQGDVRILAREPDAVRGWVAVTFTPDDEDVSDSETKATTTGDVATTTDLAGDDTQTELGVEAALKGAQEKSSSSVGRKATAGRSAMRIALRRAGSSGRVPLLAQNARQGHARRVGNALLASGRPG